MAIHYFVNPLAAGNRAHSRFQAIRSQLPVGQIHVNQLERIEELGLEDGDILVSAGGDGTLHELVNRAMKVYGSKRIRQFALGHIGLGSNNSYLRPYETCSVLKSYPLRLGQVFADHDLGEVRYRKSHGQDWNIRYFLVNASFGFLARANSIFNRDLWIQRLKKWSSGSADMVAFFRALKQFEFQRVEMELNGNKVQKEWTNIHLIKHPFYASEYRFLEEPEWNSGTFDIHWLDRTSKTEILKKFLRISAFKDYGQARSGFASTSQLHIRTDTLFDFEMDGEIVRGVEFDIRCLKGALRVCR